MRNHFIFIGILAVAVFWIGIFAALKWMQPTAGRQSSAESVADHLPGPADAGGLPVLWDAPAFVYPDQNGQVVTERTLLGHVWISDFFFTSCTTICPMMTARMAQLQKVMSSPSIQFVSFSVDPDHDTQDVLKQYSRMWRADDSRWHFLRTQRQTLLETAAGMKTFVQPPDKDTPIQHSSIFILTDARGKVRGVYDSSDSIAIQRLTADAMTLAGIGPPTTQASDAAWALPQSDQTNDSPGARLYASRGCVACHAQGAVAPALKGCFGSLVLLDDGRTVLADEAYLRQATLDPGAKGVAGYPRMMPSYRGQLTDQELNQLVVYIESLKLSPADELLTAATKPIPSDEVVDPVCRMLVQARDPTLHLQFQGKTYYFCSTTCRDQFLKAPSKYIAALTAMNASPTTKP
jgi:protein SCO1/2